MLTQTRQCHAPCRAAPGMGLLPTAFQSLEEPQFPWPPAPRKHSPYTQATAWRRPRGKGEWSWGARGDRDSCQSINNKSKVNKKPFRAWALQWQIPVSSLWPKVTQRREGDYQKELEGGWLQGTEVQGPKAWNQNWWEHWLTTFRLIPVCFQMWKELTGNVWKWAQMARDLNFSCGLVNHII